VGIDKINPRILQSNMIRNRIFLIVTCFFTGIAAVYVLYCFSMNRKHDKNGFIRLLPPHFGVPMGHIDIRYNSFYIGGLTGNGIYLGSYNTPYRIFHIGYNLKDTQSYKINWLKDARINRSALISVEGTSVYLKDGIDRRLSRTDLNSPDQEAITKTPPFTASAILDSGTFVMRCITKDKNNLLVKQKTIDKRLTQGNDLLQKQGNGIFSTDGMLIKIPGAPEFVYVYYYRNQFFLVDSGMKLIYRAKTIDTIAHVHIKIAAIKSLNEMTTAAPSLVVNRKACASDHYLFVNSGLNANNEDWDVLKTMSIMDVYDLKDGKYIVSFYLPKFGGKKMSDFGVHGNTLIAVYDHYVMTYKLNFNFLK